MFSKKINQVVITENNQKTDSIKDSKKSVNKGLDIVKINWKIHACVWLFNALCIAGGVTMMEIGKNDVAKYTPGANQSLLLDELYNTSNYAMLAFQKYKDSQEVGNNIKDLLDYLVDFKYIPNKDWTGSITIENFNNAVTEYQQWSSDDKNMYYQSISSLSEVVDNPDIPISPPLDRYDMQQFMLYLKDIDMNIYSDYASYEWASHMQITYPIVVFVCAGIVIVIYGIFLFIIITWNRL